MGRREEWIWEMQGEVAVADAASSRYRGMISIKFCIGSERMIAPYIDVGWYD